LQISSITFNTSSLTLKEITLLFIFLCFKKTKLVTIFNVYKKCKQLIYLVSKYSIFYTYSNEL